ncbi:MAG: FAD-dependent oxidoreductase [Desulfobacteraceae bacterium]
MRFVIIGGDAAGMSAASRAKRNMKDLEVVVLEQTWDVSYSACGMPYNLADPDSDINELVVREARVFREKQGIDLRTGHKVEAIDRAAEVVRGKTLQGEPFEVPYDKLLIATGASPVVPEIPGADLPGVVSLKSLQDGRLAKRLLAEPGIRQAVIVGMGYVGLEVAEALRSRGLSVDMVKPRPVLLPWLHPRLSEMVREELEAKGVNLRFGCAVQAVERAEDGLLVVCTDKIKLPCQMVVMAMGVRPNSSLAASAGLELGISEAVSVDRSLRTSDPDIYAAGDCADAYHVVTGEKTWIPLALRANRAGRAVGDNVTGREVSLPGVAGTAVFKVFDLEVARTGLTMEEAAEAGFDPEGEVIFSRTRAHAHPGSATIGVHMVGDKTSGRLLGVQMAAKEGAAHRVNAPAVALSAGMSVSGFHQCDLAYAPPFSPVWDPMLVAAEQLLKKINAPQGTKA